MTDPGFDASVLSEFRSCLVAGGAEEHLLDTLLVLCREQNRQVATCPAAHTSRRWLPDYWQGRTAFKVRFSTIHCRPCPLKSRCTRSGRRLLTLRPPEEHETLEAARQREAQLAFSKEDRQRAGIEGTISAGVRVLHLRRSRYIGLAKTHLRHVLTAAALNLIGLDAWFAGMPLALPGKITQPLYCYRGAR
ncbi:hypothetical protein BB934_28325 (plasmid) [Microvirga ossetica]|uniref:Transposase DDE domain-containing protein n=1 Tax=Microvirga ossetica TaxID=1882682 RepID=A0A1B2EQI1_9HYPH|nr:hypothetical protein BB934_28325 [Microvirga ossetica]